MKMKMKMKIEEKKLKKANLKQNKKVKKNKFEVFIVIANAGCVNQEKMLKIKGVNKQVLKIWCNDDGNYIYHW